MPFKGNYTPRLLLAGTKCPVSKKKYTFPDFFRSHLFFDAEGKEIKTASGTLNSLSI